MARGVFAVLIVVFLAASLCQPAAAAADFALVDGVVDTSNGGMSQAVLNFWKDLRIEFDGQATEMQDILAPGQGYYAEGGLVNSASGELKGVYYSQSGFFQGTFVINDSLEDSDLGTNSISRYEGQFSVYLHSGENPVTILFKGTQTTDLKIGDYSQQSQTPREFNVTFSVEGGVSVIQPTATMTFPDSCARFSDLSGQVEICVPCGLKPNGEYDYCDETWEWARLDTVLPEGTAIRTLERSSSILSFADMTTFVQKPDTIIVLSRPDQRDSQFKLLVGNLWVNVKKMLKDGSMEIEMSQAVAGIKGTTFVLEDDGSTSTLKVIEGTVEFTALADGRSQRVEAGSMISADARGLGSVQPFDTAAESAAWPQMTQSSSPASAAPGGQSIVVLPYGADAPAPAAAQVPVASGKKIGLFLLIYFIAAVLVIAAVVVIVLVTRRRKR